MYVKALIMSSLLTAPLGCIAGLTNKTHDQIEAQQLLITTSSHAFRDGEDALNKLMNDEEIDTSFLINSIEQRSITLNTLARALATLRLRHSTLTPEQRRQLRLLLGSIEPAIAELQTNVTDLHAELMQQEVAERTAIAENAVTTAPATNAEETKPTYTSRTAHMSSSWVEFAHPQSFE